jgi:hypothetical protein
MSRPHNKTGQNRRSAEEFYRCPLESIRIGSERALPVQVALTNDVSCAALASTSAQLVSISKS